jgi:uncharacterized phage protein (predicted DNA packaging)
MTSISLLRQQLNLLDGEDDVLLAAYISAAEGWISKQIGKDFADLNPVPGEITLATLQLAAAWYENREAISTGNGANEVPFGVYDLIRPHRDWTF